MNAYPDADEEFELLHQEEMEVEREMEVESSLRYYHPNPKSKISLNFDFPDIDDENLTIGEKSVQNQPEITVKNRKRYICVESLTEITSGINVLEPATKKHKPNVPSKSTHEFGVTSKKIPKWPFLTVAADFDDRLYIKVNCDSVDNDDSYSYSKSSGFSVTPYSTLKHLAEDILKKPFTQEHLGEERYDNEDTLFHTSDLWVSKYKPKTYFDLLSDEAVNRTLLNWLKMWDKIVFNKDIKTKKINEKIHLEKDLEDDGRPHYKIALLCGPPGLGKTTLAHVVAGLAGYNVVEVNSSDERTVDSFKEKLDAATQMKSVMGKHKPNCLVLDEIDGAPAQTVEFLLNYLNVKSNDKTKKRKKEKQAGIVKRPVICICNELYTPSLRSLRQQSFVIHFPQTSSIKLAQRLMEICKKQNIKTDLSTLTLLCDKAQNDIRSCISTLYFFKSNSKNRFKSADVSKSSVGQKDLQKGVFSIWKEIFQIPIKKENPLCTVSQTKDEISTPVSYSKKGMEKLQSLVQTVQSSGDYDRLLQGVFENFPKSKFLGGINSLPLALEWFTWFDIMDTNIKKCQNFVLMPYLPYSFAAWHFLFATNTFLKISYPSAGYENHMKELKFNQILSDVLLGLSPSIRAYNQRDNILLDTLPMFKVILTPPLRPVNPTLFNEKEKKDFKQILDVMIDYNLNFIQQRTMDGTYSYQFDPNIEELANFNLSEEMNIRSFSYNMKQLISHEVELERLRRTEANHPDETPKKKAVLDKTDAVRKLLPNPREIKIKENEGQYKDFFGRIVKVNDFPSGDKVITDKTNPVKSPVWFCFKEGYNNAVKKDITISDIL